MKNRIQKCTIVLLLISIAFFVGCGVEDNEPQLARENANVLNMDTNSHILISDLENSEDLQSDEPSETSEVSPYELFEGIVYSNPIFEMAVTINNPDWIYHSESNPVRLYFFNQIDSNGIDLIRISAFPFTGDASQEITRLWGEMLETHSQQPNNFVYHDAQVIQVGEYYGYLFPFEAQLDNFLFIANAVFWSTGDMMYIATTSATEDSVAEVHGVLDGLLDSFVSLSWQVAGDGDSAFWNGTELVPLKSYITSMGGQYQEIETQGEQRIVFLLDNRALLIILGLTEYAVTDIVAVDGGYTFGNTVTGFLNTPPIVRDGDVYFPLVNLANAFQWEVNTLQNP